VDLPNNCILVKTIEKFVAIALNRHLPVQNSKKFNNLPAVKEKNIIEEYEKKRKKQVSSMRSVLDYAMGFVIIGIGLFFFFRDKLKLAFNEKHPPDYMDKILGVLFFLYGVWRIYRGYKKNYFQ
jgi:hypothetical protein